MSNAYILFYATVAAVVLYAWMPSRYTDPIKNKILDLIDPHRVYMGEQVYRTTTFWSTAIYSILSVTLYSYTNSYLSVIGFLVVMHILDFGFYLLEEKYFKIEPELWVMKVREYKDKFRRSN